MGLSLGFAAEVHKAYLHSASKIIRDEGDMVTAIRSHLHYVTGTAAVPIYSNRVSGKLPIIVMLCFANHYSDDSSAVYRFTSLGCLKEDLAWFNRGIVTMG